MLLIIQPDKDIDNYQTKKQRQIKILHFLYYFLALWIVPSYLEFLHVGGMKMPLISIVLFIVSTVFVITHRQHLTITGQKVSGTFIFTWVIVCIFNFAINLFNNTMVSTLNNQPYDFEIGYLVGLGCFVLFLSYAITILVFYEPSRLKS